ncbi:cell division protein SepF [Guggenheimella bovis]
MNNFGDKVKHFFGIELDETDAPQEEVVETRPERKRYEQAEPVERKPEWEAPRERRTTVQKPVYQERIPQDNKVVICKYTPLDHRESTSIIDDIRAGRPVILNFEDTDDFVAAKIINICEGAAYALDADISKIANEIFIVVPHGIDIMNNISNKPVTSEGTTY